MKDYQVNYRPYNHYDWLCSYCVKADNAYEAVEACRKHIAKVFGKTGFEIVNTQVVR